MGDVMIESIKDISVHLSFIQKTLNAPKNRKNTFGNYNYRNCEDILEAVKKIMPDGCYVTLSDAVIAIGDRLYVKAKATFSFAGNEIFVEAFAREINERKGYDPAQITGAASSYARKYALNGLFCIDDSKDIDAHEPKEEKVISNTNALITTDEALHLSKLIFDAKVDSKKFMQAYKVNAINGLSKLQFEDAVKKCNAKIKAAQNQNDPSKFMRV